MIVGLVFFIGLVIWIVEMRTFRLKTRANRTLSRTESCWAVYGGILHQSKTKEIPNSNVSILISIKYTMSI